MSWIFKYLAMLLDVPSMCCFKEPALKEQQTPGFQQNLHPVTMIHAISSVQILHLVHDRARSGIAPALHLATTGRRNGGIGFRCVSPTGINASNFANRLWFAAMIKNHLSINLLLTFNHLMPHPVSHSSSAGVNVISTGDSMDRVARFGPKDVGSST